MTRTRDDMSAMAECEVHANSLRDVSIEHGPHVQMVCSWDAEDAKSGMGRMLFGEAVRHGSLLTKAVERIGPLV